MRISKKFVPSTLEDLKRYAEAGKKKREGKSEGKAEARKRRRAERKRRRLSLETKR